jgi:hypothetical protein
MARLTDLYNDIQEIVFHYIKDNDIDIDGDMGSILQDTAKDFISRMYNEDIEHCINEFGIMDALDIYDKSYHLSSLEDLDKRLRAIHILMCAVVDYLEYDIDYRYIDWYEENKEEKGEGEGEDEGEGEGESEGESEGEGEETTN